MITRDFGVHELRRLLRHLAAMLELATEEELLLVVADEDRADGVGESPLRDVAARERRSPAGCRSPRPSSRGRGRRSSSSATRPPYAITSLASSCWRVTDTRSSSGSVNASPARARAARS